MQDLDQDIYSWVGKVIYPDMTATRADHNLLALSEYSSAQGMQTAFLVAVVLVFIGFLLSLFMKPPPPS